METLETISNLKSVSNKWMQHLCRMFHHKTTLLLCMAALGFLRFCGVIRQDVTQMGRFHLVGSKSLVNIDTQLLHEDKKVEKQAQK